MFTVKWIGDNGCEFLYGDARGVSYTAGGADRKATVAFYCMGEQSVSPGDCHVTIDSGRVYVMNEKGRTVADYVLSTQEFPHGLAPKQAA